MAVTAIGGRYRVTDTVGSGAAVSEATVGVTDDFAAFVQPHLPTLTWLAARLAPGEHEDVVQEALTRAWRKRAQFDPDKGSARAWLCAVLASQARRVVRRPPGGPVAELIVQPPDSAARIDLGRALDVLTDRQRLAVDCHYLVGLSVAETAVVMQCSAGTVKSTLSDARVRLRRALTPTDRQEDGS